MYRQPVLQAMHPTGILRYVAANGAGNLTGRVGCVVQAVGGGGLADSEVAHTRLDDGGAAVGVNALNTVELGQAQGHAHAVGEGAP